MTARAAVAAAVALAGCADPGGGLRPIDDRIPKGWPEMVVPDDNPTTAEGVALGRQLYYDPRLSSDGSRACATCHRQDQAFSNASVTGVLPHINLGWSRHFLWNGGFDGTLEHAMQLEVEEFFHADLARLDQPDLRSMFEAAFGTPEVTTQRAAYALAQFQRTMVSAGAAYDRYVEGDDGALEPAAHRGMEVFYSERAECFHCHATRLFTDNEFHNNGLDADVAGTGRAVVSGSALDDGKRKTPTLRDVALTAPYMHDDRFATLEEVVDFYSDGVAGSPTLDPLIPAGGYHLTADERADLVAFLRALTDAGYTTDPSLGPPP